jgi:hypothetical protein
MCYSFAAFAYCERMLVSLGLQGLQVYVLLLCPSCSIFALAQLHYLQLLELLLPLV